jgi:hypothetical protein
MIELAIVTADMYIIKWFFDLSTFNLSKIITLHKIVLHEMFDLSKI